MFVAAFGLASFANSSGEGFLELTCQLLLSLARLVLELTLHPAGLEPATL
jgi:hypothetical protein